MFKITKQDLQHILVALSKIAILFLLFIVVRIIAGMSAIDSHSLVRVLPEISNSIIPITSMVLFVVVPVSSLFFLVKLNLTNKKIKYLCVIIFGFLSIFFSGYLFFSTATDLINFDFKYHKVVTENNQVYYVIETNHGSFLEGRTGFDLYKKVSNYTILKISTVDPYECFSSNGECEDKIKSGIITFVVDSNNQKIVYNILKNILHFTDNK